ncbi:hypothetical protein B4907_01540 [Yersinia kristensenii]|nr:hypothetical protein B4907_01540 [Yersinia kristensenii]
MPLYSFNYPRHTSSCKCVGCSREPESLTDVSSSGLTRWPPSCNSNYLGYIPFELHVTGC